MVQIFKGLLHFQYLHTRCPKDECSLFHFPLCKSPHFQLQSSCSVWRGCGLYRMQKMTYRLEHTRFLHLYSQKHRHTIQNVINILLFNFSITRYIVQFQILQTMNNEVERFILCIIMLKSYIKQEEEENHSDKYYCFDGLVKR